MPQLQTNGTCPECGQQMVPDFVGTYPDKGIPVWECVECDAGPFSRKLEKAEETTND